nr:immunoglobulin heavy chain junction region [Macaca mulatta]MPN70427.1 immunoglobulin heavy chain junction region [Macaca mulatta]
CARDWAYRSGFGHWSEYSTFDYW